MFATGEQFEYFRCTACGCLQIGVLPADLGRFYPAGYYSYQSGVTRGLRERLRRWRNAGLLQGGAAAGLAWLQPFAALASLRRLGLSRHDRVLDVGCGQGQLVCALRELGFAQAVGIDPLATREQPPWLLRRELAETDAGWQLIMLHHSLEHLPDPRAACRIAAERLAPQGRLLIRVPTVDSWAYRHYASDWVQWDAPRHLHLFSRRNLAQLAEQAGLRLLALWDDSEALQFWGSAHYRRSRLPLAAANAGPHPWASLRAMRLNARAQGDQIVAVLGR